MAVPTSLPEHPPVPGDLVLDCDQAMRSLDTQATQPVGDTATPETTDREQTVEITLGPMSVRSGRYQTSRLRTSSFAITALATAPLGGLGASNAL